MKKILTGAALLSAMLFGKDTQAQELGFGIKGGYGKSVVRAPKRSDIYNIGSIYTFNAMAYLDIPLSDGFSIQPGLAVNGKGAKINVYDQKSGTYTNYESNPIYLELPVHAVAKIAIGDIFDKCNILLGGGPFVSYGVSGKQKVNGKFLGKSFSSEDNIIFSNDDAPVNSRNFYGEFKQFDFGLNAIAGIEYHWATFNLTYSYGVVNVNPGANLTQIDRLKNRVLSASIGVRF